MSAAIYKEYPSLAEIVRQETDGGRRIVQFYLGVAAGTLDGFRDHHRMAAANRIGKIAPKLVAQYLQKYYNNQCRDSYRGTSLLPVRRSPITKNPPERSQQAPRGPNAFQRRLAQLVRDETGDGRTIFNFLNGVMHGTYTGFEPHHRLEAAKELASYLNPSVIPVKTGTHPPPWEPAPAKAGVIPAEAGTHPSPLSAAHPEPAEEADPNSPVIPASPTVIPVKTGTHPSPLSSSKGSPSQSSQSPNPANPGSDNPTRPEPAEAPHLPTKNPKPKTKNPPITLEELHHANFDSHHIARYSFARDDITGAIYAIDELGPLIVDEDGVPHSISPDRIAGYRPGSHTKENASRTNINQYLPARTAHTRNNPNAPINNPKPTTKNLPRPPPRPRFWT